MTTRTRQQLHDDLDALLEGYVDQVRAEIPSAQVRQGQSRMAHDLLDSCLSRSSFVGVGPTGLGKASVLLSVAFVLALRLDERTALSTYSNMLLGQMLTKDGPMMNAAAQQVFGEQVSLRSFKGQGNYVCQKQVFVMLARAISYASQLVSLEHPDLDGLEVLLREFLGTRPASLEDRRVHEFMQQLAAGRVERSEFEIDGIAIGNQQWGAVSPEVCDKGECPFSRDCPMLEARRRAASADIVVTNHSMLGIQASKSVPLVLGSRTLGGIHHLMCDEAHHLPSVVRDQSRTELTGKKLVRAGSDLTRTLERDIDGEHLEPFAQRAMERLAELAVQGSVLGPLLAEQMLASLDNQGRRDCKDGLPDDVEATMLRAEKWCAEVSQEGEKLARGLLRISEVESLSSVLRSFEKLSSALRLALEGSVALALSRVVFGAPVAGKSFVSGDDEKSVKTPGARWIESSRENGSPVATWCHGSIDVADSIATRLVNPMHNFKQGDDLELIEQELAVGRPSFAAVSATLPKTFCEEIGLDPKRIPTDYPSPFDVAYRRARCYVPMLTAQENQRLFPRGTWDRFAHAEWAAEQITLAVLQNHGRALVVCANKSNQQLYERKLRQHLVGTGIELYVQPESTAGLDQVTKRWIADEHSVLLGVDSVGTGLDARGATCSLVIVDRPSRRAGNFVDDARVEAAQRRFGLDKWSASSHVYVADAALRLEQAVGRLIRDVTDYGMVMVLDPRLVVDQSLPSVQLARSGNPLLVPTHRPYSKAESDGYLRALRRFRDVGTIVHDRYHWGAMSGQWLSTLPLEASES